jgi:hypothetical protein
MIPHRLKILKHIQRSFIVTTNNIVVISKIMLVLTRSLYEKD